METKRKEKSKDKSVPPTTAAATTAGSSLFGSAAPAATGTSHFGAAPAATTTAAPATGGLVGAPAATTAPTGGLFGAPSTTTTAPATGGMLDASLLSAPTTTTTAAPAATTATPPSDTAAVAATTATPRFGALTTSEATTTATTRFGATTTTTAATSGFSWYRGGPPSTAAAAVLSADSLMRAMNGRLLKLEKSVNTLEGGRGEMGAEITQQTGISTTSPPRVSPLSQFEKNKRIVCGVAFGLSITKVIAGCLWHLHTEGEIDGLFWIDSAFYLGLALMSCVVGFCDFESKMQDNRNRRGGMGMHSSIIDMEEGSLTRPSMAAPSGAATTATSATSSAAGLPSGATQITTTTASTTLGIGATPTPAPAGTAPTLTAISTGTPLLYGEMDTIVNGLVADLDAQEKTFLAQAVEVNAYDRVVRENETRIVAVDDELRQLEDARDQINHNIDFIENQNKELEKFVKELEDKLRLPEWSDQDRPLPLDMSCATAADVQRHNIMNLLTTVDSQAKNVESDIEEVVKHLHSLRSSHETADACADSTNLECLILQKQMGSLQWIEQKTEELQSRASAISSNLLDA